MDAIIELSRQDNEANSVARRLSVLEMTIAAVAARLPPEDRAEVAAMLVFVAKSADAAAAVAGACSSGQDVGRSSGEYAVAMLERIATSRKPDVS